MEYKEYMEEFSHCNGLEILSMKEIGIETMIRRFGHVGRTINNNIVQQHQCIVMTSGLRHNRTWTKYKHMQRDFLKKVNDELKKKEYVIKIWNHS